MIIETQAARLMRISVLPVLAAVGKGGQTRISMARYDNIFPRKRVHPKIPNPI